MSYVKLKKEDGLAVLTINRKEALNALNHELLYELQSVLTLLEKDRDTRVIIITGRGKAFIAGADIKKMREMNYPSAKEYSKLGQTVLNRIENSSLIVIAAVNGYAIGGGNELALSCDIRLASTKAKFSQPEVSLGITAGFGATQRLLRIVGEAKARELLLTGRTITAEEAYKIGLINLVVDDGELLKQASRLALTILENGPLAVIKNKKAINHSLNLSLKDGLEIERELFAECFKTNDQKEGMTAFLEKRPPKFRGK
ncbi:MAG: enoyl-CoA hydratase/isomerase family protein [Halothermotrichaceae bacterium]